MFGLLSANVQGLTEEQLSRYRGAYCGLCRSMGERHGALSRMSLSYDMSFLVLLLSSLYEPEEQGGEDSCPVHPREKRGWWKNAVTDYAADMNVALAYLKCRDDWQDDGRVSALAASGFLKKEYEGIKELYPRQCLAMEDAVAKLRAVELSRADVPDEAAACFGSLLGEIFVLYDDRWSAVLRGMGSALGRFIYIMDACLDLDSDTVHDRYNPLRRYYGLENEQRFRDILRMLLGDCLYCFDYLPLVQDAELMKNILCSGLWAEFDKKYSRMGSSNG